MTYPPLPEPTIIDGRRLYTAGQMREYASIYASEAARPLASMKEEVKSRNSNDAGAVDALFGIFWIKK